MICTISTCLVAGLYTWFSTSRRGNIIPASFSKHLMLPALLNGYHQEPLPYGTSLCSIIPRKASASNSALEIGYAPSRILSLVITLYVVMNIIFCCVPFKSVQPNTWYSNKKGELAAYLSNRTGVISFANIALAILFTGRNNPLLYVTRLSRTTCLIFHRWAARVATLQAVVHSVRLQAFVKSISLIDGYTEVLLRLYTPSHTSGMVELQRIMQRLRGLITGGE